MLKDYLSEVLFADSEPFGVMLWLLSTYNHLKISNFTFQLVYLL
jgi:hypothetical protein